MAQQRTVQVAVTTAGTAVQGPDVDCRFIYAQASKGNTGSYVIIGNDGADDVSATTGYHLKTDGPPLPVRVNNLNELWFDAESNGDKVEIFIVSFYE